MNYNYLNKVVDILVGETTINNYGVNTPFSSFPFPFPLLSFLNLTQSPTYFSEFVIDYYGLTENEIDYVWGQYSDIINNRI